MEHFLSHPYHLNKLIEVCSKEEQEAIRNCFTYEGSLKTSYTVFTSGSTGKPKEIRLTQAQVLASIQKTASYLQLQKGDVSFICLSANYIAGKMMWLRSYVIGMDVFMVVPKANPLDGVSIKQRIDFAAFVPMQLQCIIEQTPDKLALLQRAKAILIGGAPISTYQQKLFEQIKAPLYQTYGMTETVSHIAMKRLNSENKYYTLLSDVEAKVDERSCLCIKADVTNNQYLMTNDRVVLHGKRQFEWLGRVDNVVNTGGVKIQLEELEEKIGELFYNMGYYERFFVSSIADNKLGQKLVLYVEGEEKDILTMLRTKLSKFELPKEVFFKKTFCLTATGKIDRKQTAVA